MADRSKIEWTNATWNPITGCSVISPGCKRCYAMRLAGTRLRHHWSRKGLTRPSKAGPVWTGEVRFNEEWLSQPLHWRKPRNIFVCAHGDLFHENVPDAWIDRVFLTMSFAPQHIFQVLTKRSARMRKYIAGFEERRRTFDCHAGLDDAPWPLPNVWAMVSVEDQPRADERIADLRATPAAVRGVSAEPLLGPLDLDLRGIGWVIAGAESGKGARAMDEDWVRGLRDQCRAAKVPFFYKQNAIDGNKIPTPELDGRRWMELPKIEAPA
jgi:protein gp37